MNGVGAHRCLGEIKKASALSDMESRTLEIALLKRFKYENTDVPFISLIERLMHTTLLLGSEYFFDFVSFKHVGDTCKYLKDLWRLSLTIDSTNLSLLQRKAITFCNTLYLPKDLETIRCHQNHLLDLSNTEGNGTEFTDRLKFAKESTNICILTYFGLCDLNNKEFLEKIVNEAKEEKIGIGIKIEKYDELTQLNTLISGKLSADQEYILRNTRGLEIAYIKDINEINSVLEFFNTPKLVTLKLSIVEVELELPKFQRLKELCIQTSWHELKVADLPCLREFRALYVSWINHTAPMILSDLPNLETFWANTAHGPLRLENLPKLKKFSAEIIENELTVTNVPNLEEVLVKKAENDQARKTIEALQDQIKERKASLNSAKPIENDIPNLEEVSVEKVENDQARKTIESLQDQIQERKASLNSATEIKKELVENKCTNLEEQEKKAEQYRTSLLAKAIWYFPKIILLLAFAFFRYKLMFF